MTEAEWLGATDPTLMLQFLHGKASERKLRLSACGIHRSVWTSKADSLSRNAVETAERFADGSTGRPAMAVVRNLFREEERSRLRAAVAASGAPTAASEAIVWSACWDAAKRCLRASAMDAAVDAVRAADVAVRFGQRGNLCSLSHVLRDIFGNPFRPVAADPSWLTSTVVGLAQAIYNERAFDRLPILGDALEEAGCDDADVLSHCRSEGQAHVRGCWVVDSLLGKT